MSQELSHYLSRIANALEKLVENAVPSSQDIAQTLKSVDAFIWSQARKCLIPVPNMQTLPIESLIGIKPQSTLVVENTLNFARGLPANNVMIWGARGMGKSSLVKASVAAVNRQHDHAIALIEIARDDIAHLQNLWLLLRDQSRRCIVYCDDLSFETADAHYKSLKTVLDGGLFGRSDNLLFYATSNRRHLMPRDMHENLEQGVIHPQETADEKISLSDRFGLWIGIHGCDQNDYLEIVAAYARARGLQIPPETLRHDAIQWALERGARSGRVAVQFIDHACAQLGIMRDGRQRDAAPCA